MRKIVLILYIFILSASCSVSRKHLRNRSAINETSVAPNPYENIINHNLTSGNFYIERAEFRLTSGHEVKSGIGTIKFLMPDKFLICIKSNSGLEIARILLSGDSIFVNDRFNRKLFYGSASYLKNKYGLTTSILPVILGDYVNDERMDSSKIKCIDNKLDVVGIVKGIRIRYVIDCEEGKAILTMPEDIKNESQLQIEYSDFFKSNRIIAPGKIEIAEKKSNAKIEIRIQKISAPWEGTIEFLPGKQFEKIPLL